MIYKIISSQLTRASCDRLIIRPSSHH